MSEREGVAKSVDAADATASVQVPSRIPTRLRRGAVICLGAAAIVLSLAAHQFAYFRSDVEITRSVQAADLRPLALPIFVMNRLGFPPLVGIVYCSVVVVIFVAGKRWEAASASFALLGGATINNLTKMWVDRPRPSGELVHVEHIVSNPSYPAGHVLNFTAFAGFLCFLIYLHMRPSLPRMSLMTLLLLMIMLMGLARIESGEHWPSDVLGGYLLGTLWLAGTVAFYQWGCRRFTGLRAGGSHRDIARVFGTALVLLSPIANLRPAHAAAEATDSLAATVAVPWNPPRPMSRRQGWEHVVLLPGRILTLPLSGLGYVADHALLTIEENPKFTNSLSGGKGTRVRPLTIGTARLGDRSGLGASIEARKSILHDHYSSILSARYAATIHNYNRTQLTWSGEPAALQYGYEWRPQDRFYGVGNDSPQDSVSDYALQSEFVRGSVVWASNREDEPARSRTAVTLSAGPSSRVTRTGREGGAVSFDTRFPSWGNATLDQRVEQFVYGASLSLDHRTGVPHWSRGWRTLISADRFDAPLGALALHSGSANGAQFTRYQAQAEAGISFMRDPRTLRLSVHMTDLDVSSAPELLLIPDLSMLGGHAGLGGYSPGRFHDLDMLLTRVDYVFPLQRSFEMNLHSEWGAVYPDLWNDAKLRSLHNSFGFALRLRDAHAPRASVGLDFSHESTRLRFSIGSVE
ncbi:MAG: phosphatase PAP2 family protein [Candidatus Eisenbacteria bacterium]